MERIGLKPKIRRIGLTGLFCAGKSTVADIFSDMGGFCIDSDKVVADLLQQPVIQKHIEQLIGKAVFYDGNYKGRLADLLFGSKALLSRYCNYLYPKVLAKIQEQERQDKINVWEVPLLYEAGWNEFVDTVVLVVSDENSCKERALQRGFGEDDFYRRLSVFWPQEKKIELADFIIENRGTKEDLRVQVKDIWEKITKGEGI